MYGRTDGRMDVECHLYVSALWYNIYRDKNDTRMTEHYAEFAIETTKQQISRFPTCHIILNMHVLSYLEISQDVLM